MFIDYSILSIKCQGYVERAELELRFIVLKIGRCEQWREGETDVL